MPLLLESCTDNELEFRYGEADDETLVMYYKDPTTSQRIAYSNALVKHSGGKIKMNLAHTRLRGGLALITGIREGDLALPDGRGGHKLVSSDPSSTDYRKDWKELIKQYRADMLILLGAHVFEQSAITGEKRADEFIDSLGPDDLELDVSDDFSLEKPAADVAAVPDMHGSDAAGQEAGN